MPTQVTSRAHSQAAAAAEGSSARRELNLAHVFRQRVAGGRWRGMLFCFQLGWQFPCFTLHSLHLLSQAGCCQAACPGQLWGSTTHAEPRCHQPHAGSQLHIRTSPTLPERGPWHQESRQQWRRLRVKGNNSEIFPSRKLRHDQLFPAATASPSCPPAPEGEAGMSQKVQSPGPAGREDPRTCSMMGSAPEHVKKPQTSTHTFHMSFSKGIAPPAVNHSTCWAACSVVF